MDEAALAQALDNKLIAGAALDVGRAQDQMPSLALARRADVIATPHTAGLTPEAAEHQAFDTVNQVRELVAGRMPPGAANAQMRAVWPFKRFLKASKPRVEFFSPSTSKPDLQPVMEGLEEVPAVCGPVYHAVARF